MKSSFKALLAFTLLIISIGCTTDDGEDLRKLVSQPVYPNDQPNELNNALELDGEMITGNVPATINPENIRVTISVPTATISSDNFLFLPFGFDAVNELEGIYLQVEGASNHWEAPIELVDPGDNSAALAIGIPAYVQEGDFKLSYKLYDNQNNVSQAESIDVSVSTSQSFCGTSQGFPRVAGQDGVTVRAYDFGNEPGTINVTYFMYSRRDRMDIRYNNQWVASTSSTLLAEGQAPPFKTCSEASPDQGFVSGGGSLSIAYDPAISREVSIYVSGCLQGGTQWYFDVDCPNTSGSTEPIICDKPSAQDSYDPTDPNYHKYPREGQDLSTVICDPNTDPDCTVSAVFDAMLERADLIAPTNDQGPVTDCKVTWVTIFTGNNPVATAIDYSRNSIINYTLDNEKNPSGVPTAHFLHPGKVTRTIELIDGKVVVSTEGEGTGIAGGLNESASGFIWGRVDQRLKDYWRQLN